MERTLLFETIIFDSALIDQRLTYKFFQENEENEQSITNLPEQQALRWIMNIAPFRKMFLGRFFPKPDEIKTYYDQTYPFTSPNKLPGDIDMIIADPHKPDQAIAFECKKVKAVAQNTEPPKINNLKSLHHGVKQANAYQSLGFYQSYLMILLLDDGRTLTTPNTMFRYNKHEMLEAIYNIQFTEPIHADVGVIYVRINQMTGKHYNHSASLGFCIDKHAGSLGQTVEMTNKIRELILSQTK